jgi:uncharacterized repeat protein (TIGR01451 family)
MRPRSRLFLWLWLAALVAGTGAVPVSGQSFTFGQAQLYVTKTVDRSTVAPGDVITYTLTYGNTGTGDATGVAISDVLPQGTTFVDTTGNGILFGTTVFWSPGSVSPGQTGTVTLRLRANPGLPTGTPITNTAQISSVEGPIGVPSNGATVTVNPAPLPSPLVVTKQVDAASAAPGQSLTFLITVRNSASTPTTGVTVTDPIPVGATAVSASDSGAIAGGVARWSLGPLAAGATRQVSLRVTVNNNAGSTLTNTAQAVSDGTQAVSSNSVTVLVSTAANLTLTKGVDKAQAGPGDTLTYTISFTNNGGVPIANGSLFDVIPPGTLFVDATNGGQLSGSTLVWTFSSLAPGMGGVVSFRVRVQNDVVPGTVIRNQAQLAVVAQGTVLTSNAALTTIAQQGVSLTLAKAVDRTAARPGDVITYTLSYSNLGPGTATNAEIVDPVPPGLVFLDAQGSVQVDIQTRTLRFNLGNLPASAIGSVSFRARVHESVTAGTSLTNQASLTAAGQTAPVSSNSVTTAIGGAGTSGYAGTYRLIESLNPSSMTVDSQNKFTIITVARDRLTPGLGAQGSLRPDGSFDVTDASGRVRFVGRVDPATRTATATVQRAVGASYSLVLPRAPDFSQVPESFVGTFVGFATNPQGDRLTILLTIDLGGNSTFQADLIQTFPTLIRHRSGSYQISPNGLVGFGGRTDGQLQAAGNSLVLIYNYTAAGYQSLFQIPLNRR